MLDFLIFISKQKIRNIILVYIFIIPYILWIIWFAYKNIHELVSWIVSKAGQNRREIKILAGKIKHYIWIVYNNIYIALLIPFIVFCIKWYNFNKYASEVITAASLISIPYIMYILLQLRNIFSNLLDWYLRLINVLADKIKRSTRKIVVYVISFLMMPYLALVFIIFIVSIPIMVAWIYVEWIQQLARMIKNRGIVKQKKTHFLYKFRSLENWEAYKKNYLEGKLYFPNRRELHDPAECISLYKRSASKMEDGDYDPLDKYRICSMTGDPGNFVMWANYSSNNTGVCIEYLIDKELLKKEGIICKKVFYTKFLPSVQDFVYPYDSLKEELTWKDKDIRKFIFHKLDDWKYEDEWRLVKKFDKPNEPDSKLYCLEIGTVERIICGYKCTTDFVEKLKKEVTPIPVVQVTYERYNSEAVNLCVPRFSSDVFGNFENDEWKYFIMDGAVKITAYIGKNSDIDIPTDIRGIPVTKIGENAFKNREDITSLTIHSGVSIIEPFAFSGCSELITVSLGKGLKTIGKKAFAFCSALTSLILPNGVSKIGKGAFRNCSALTFVRIPGSVSKIGKDAFRKCYKICSVSISEEAKQRIKASVFEDSPISW